MINRKCIVSIHHNLQYVEPAGYIFPACFFADLGYRRGDFPVSESACERNLSLPMYPDLTDEQIHYVAETLRRFFEERSA